MSLDHQSGLFQTVKDISVTELRNNTIMLAKLATLLKIPVITLARWPWPFWEPVATRIAEGADGWTDGEAPDRLTRL